MPHSRLAGLHNCFGSVTYVEFRQDRGHVGAHGLLAEAEAAGDLAVGLSSRDVLEDVVLAR